MGDLGDTKQLKEGKSKERGGGGGGCSGVGSASGSGSVASARKGKEEKHEREAPIDMPAMLLAAADRFQVPELVGLCAEKLAESITLDNAIDRMILADSCQAPLLKVHRRGHALSLTCFVC